MSVLEDVTPSETTVAVDNDHGPVTLIDLNGSHAALWRPEHCGSIDRFVHDRMLMLDSEVWGRGVTQFPLH